MERRGKGRKLSLGTSNSTNPTKKRKISIGRGKQHVFGNDNKMELEN